MTSPGPILSVVLCTRNQLNHLKFTLLSLQDQAPDIPHEVIVVDCGSSDGTGQFLAGQARKGTVRTVLNRENRSRTSARNQGARAAQGKFLMFLDPGMIVGPRWWEALLRTLDKDPRVGAVGGKIILPDGRIDHAGLALLEWWDAPDDSGELPAYGRRLSARSILAGKPAEIPASNRPLLVQALAGEGLMVRAGAFFATGGFSTRLGRGHGPAKADCEGELSGVDLCLRLGRRGWDCVYRHESVMTRLRRPPVSGETGPDGPADAREQEIFNRTWLGRVRGDFRIIPGKGTVPAEGSLVRNYIEPVIRFEVPGALGMVHPAGRVSRSMSSVVVATGKDLETTRRCVTALLAHTDAVHEILFVLDGDNPEIHRYLQEVAAGRQYCRIVAVEGNPGSAAACNRGLAAARGKHVVLLSDHTVVTPRWLEILVTTADLHPRAGLVGPMTNRGGGMQQVVKVDYDETSLRGLNSFAGLVAEDRGGRVEKVLRLSGFCLLVKRELMARIGGLDEKFELGNYEDSDYCLRSRLAGYENLVARGCFVHHRDDSALTAEQLEQIEHLGRQWQIFKAKWGIPADTALNEPMDTAALLAGGFHPVRHFQPLPLGMDGITRKPVQAVRTAEA